MGLLFFETWKVSYCNWSDAAEAPCGRRRRETCTLPSLIPSVVVDVVVTVTSLQAPLRRRRQLEHRGPAHPSQARLPGAITVRGFPNTLIQVRHVCESPRLNVGEVVYGTGAAGGGGPVKC